MTQHQRQVATRLGMNSAGTCARSGRLPTFLVRNRIAAEVALSARRQVSVFSSGSKGASSGKPLSANVGPRARLLSACCPPPPRTTH